MREGRPAPKGLGVASWHDRTGEPTNERPAGRCGMRRRLGRTRLLGNRGRRYVARRRYGRARRPVGVNVLVAGLRGCKAHGEAVLEAEEALRRGQCISSRLRAGPIGDGHEPIGSGCSQRRRRCAARPHSARRHGSGLILGFPKLPSSAVPDVRRRRPDASQRRCSEVCWAGRTSKGGNMDVSVKDED